jgi:hypothetical protein
MRLNEIFNQQNKERDKYLSRVLGIFSEGIAALWFASDYSPYSNLGNRPTIYRRSDEQKGYTLDFTLKEKGKNNEIYISEMKCELEYDNYKYLVLNDFKQLSHHKGEAFSRFLAFAKNPEEYKVKVDGKIREPKGSILIWGAVSKEGKSSVIQHTQLSDILSLEDMLNDLAKNRNSNGLSQFLDQYKEWTMYLFEKLGA